MYYQLLISYDCSLCMLNIFGYSSLEHGFLLINSHSILWHQYQHFIWPLFIEFSLKAFLIIQIVSTSVEASKKIWCIVMENVITQYTNSLNSISLLCLSSQMCNKVDRLWLPSHIKVVQLIVKVCKIAGYFLDISCIFEQGDCEQTCFKFSSYQVLYFYHNLLQMISKVDVQAILDKFSFYCMPFCCDCAKLGQ